MINKSKKLNFRTKFIILIKYKINNLYKLLNVTNDKTFLLRNVQILKSVFLNKIQKTSNNFLIDEINAFRLINKRKKHKILLLCDAQKNSKRIFSNIAVNKDITSKISNVTNENLLNNDLILNDLNKKSTQNVQKLIFENNFFFKSRDIDSLMKIFIINSNFDELNESNHVTSKNSLFEINISSIHAQIVQLQNL